MESDAEKACSFLRISKRSVEPRGRKGHDVIGESYDDLHYFEATCHRWRALENVALHDYFQKINHDFIMFVNIYISGTFHTKRILVIYLYQNAPNNPLNK